MSDNPNGAPQKKKRNFLTVYVATLLAIAMILLVFSFLQNRRASEQLTSLAEEHNAFSGSALQSIQDLQGRVDALAAENSALAADIEKLDGENGELRRQLGEARDELSKAQIELSDAADERDALRAMLDSLAADGAISLELDESGNIISATGD